MGNKPERDPRVLQRRWLATIGWFLLLLAIATLLFAVVLSVVIARFSTSLDEVDHVFGPTYFAIGLASAWLADIVAKSYGEYQQLVELEEATYDQRQKSLQDAKKTRDVTCIVSACGGLLMGLMAIVLAGF